MASRLTDQLQRRDEPKMAELASGEDRSVVSVLQYDKQPLGHDRNSLLEAGDKSSHFLTKKEWSIVIALRLWDTCSVPKPEPIVTLIIDQRIVYAKCSECGEPLELGVTVGSAKEQESKLQAAFGKHMDAKHRSP